MEIDSQKEQIFVENFLNRARSTYFMKSGVWLGASDCNSEGISSGHMEPPQLMMSFQIGLLNGELNDASGEDCTELDKEKG